ncbi:multidrug effflux MFS transporter [Novosphingobium sp. 1949]|uniref:Bcr/CflA family efflux transporter n=1 Tax=Novosphingobium organovorum TaxID=2930092 RepID=A0ABT0B9R8_9SPHN|nr:multidrug effflux MFS transporter [Novosphingobium organovorum]MCJ2181789.1 multidrug effflux MFS transporter [Novosphingobium organovorum]
MQASLGFGIALGFLSALGPLAIDLYLPAMPDMASALGGSENAVQRTLSAFFFGLAFAQIPIGALADRFGRRVPLVCGLGLFVLTSLACSAVTSLDQLVALRFVQGMGACAGTSSARAIIRDLHRGHHAARLMAFTFLVIGLSPMLAPLLGSGLLQLVSWRGLFGVLAGAGLVAAVCVIVFLPETLEPARRVADWSGLPRALGALLANTRFIGWALVAGLATTVPFAFVTAAPFLYSGVYGLPPVWFSLLLALNAGASIAATQAAPHLLKRLGPARLAIRAALAALGATALLGLGAVTLPGGVPLALFQAYSVLLFVIAGFVLTPAATSALDAVREGIGSAAGLLGTIQLAVTAIASGAVALWPPVSLQPLGLVLGGAFALMLAIVTAMARGKDLA